MRLTTLMLCALALTACSSDDTTPGGSGGGGEECNVCEAPQQSEAMFAFLQNGDYAGWDTESAAHASTGPHGAPVRVYISPALSGSLAAGNASHDRGSAVVKELLDDDMTTVTGWAAWVKTADDSGGGNNIWWYENFSVTSNTPVAESFGPSGCTNCHSGGNDFLLIPYPLN